MQRKTVLIVDDERGFIEPLQDALDYEGFRVLTATNAEKALWILKEERVDLATVDIMMAPGRSLEAQSRSQGTKEMTYGWKLHLLVDCEYELPIAASISPGNVHDSRRASYLLSEARFTYSRFHPKYVMADQGYSGKPLSSFIKRQYRTTPIIQPNKVHKKLLAELEGTMGMPQWKDLYKQRQAVERINSRLKGQRSLNSITVRGRMKVTAHCYLSLIALQATVCISSAKCHIP